ncbi:hypothetical protein [Comamonas sp.]|uniref:hypothetical protein n=1 Tax=Comamonas sp. TaxID=34028 RepID=UPI0028A6F386|nr:hypothetical protein [Comamonas sp.]
MSNSTEDNIKPDPYLEELKEEGADLLIRGSGEESLLRARLSRIDAKIEQLTSPITSGDWTEPKE